MTDFHSDEQSNLTIVTWNVAAVNNNPFEYWITSPDPAYMQLMYGVQEFMESQQCKRRVDEIFTDIMFSELMEEMTEKNIPMLDEVERIWNEDYRNRVAIQEFLMDTSIGEKRLTSMPDRITNTINLHDGTKCMRPTAINAYCEGSLNSMQCWWLAWKDFMFRREVQIFGGDAKSPAPKQVVCRLVGPILRSKYPSISAAEQAASIPLQILCLAILDAIFIWMLNSVFPEWERVRSSLCDALINEKSARVCDILAHSYADTDVIFLQEAAAIFVQHVGRHAALSARFRLLAPPVLDGKRDQNSLILISRRRFADAPFADVTSLVLDALGGPFAAPGDLLAVDICSAAGARFLLASFHGDSNGLSAQPVVQALRDVAGARFPAHLLVLGLDANTHSRAADAYHHSVAAFCRFLAVQGLASCWGPAPDPALWTTSTARTYLQTQLSKATPAADRAAASRRNLKDWVVVAAAQAKAVSPGCRDNTGRGAFAAGVVPPSLEFPSDHVLVAAAVRFRPEAAAAAAAISPQIVPQAAQDVPVAAALAAAERGGERTLYDYWGLARPPAGLQALTARRPRLARQLSLAADDAAEAAAAGQFCARLDADAAAVCARMLARRAGPGGAGAWDDPVREDVLGRGRDGWVWILFSGRPFSTGMGQPWFRQVRAVPCPAGPGRVCVAAAWAGRCSCVPRGGAREGGACVGGRFRGRGRLAGPRSRSAGVPLPRLRTHT
jgi:hypothetical protein